MQARLAQVRATYEGAGQGHVLRHAEKLSESELGSLVEQLEQIDVKRVLETYQLSVQDASNSSKLSAVNPLPEVANFSRLPAQERSDYVSKGLSLIGAGRVGYLLLAGGQGTRLGTTDPKGCYDIGLPSKKSLFQLMAERLMRLRQISGGSSSPIPWYVMTSPMTDEQTKSFFAKHDFFGLRAADVFFFQQGTLPCLDLAGNILMDSTSQVARAPDGNGGIYRALKNSGALQDMRKRGVSYIHCSSVDNALVLPADPLFIEGGGAKVVEYSEISQEAAREVDPATGTLRLNAGNICNHFYTVDFLDKASDLLTPYHIAKKKIPCIDESGQRVVPQANNGIKLEQFIFDCFPHSKSFACAEVVREEEFGPVKNAPGSAVDSPDTARALLLDLGRKYVEEAGGCIEGEGPVEVSPLLSYSGEGLEETCKGKTIKAPTILLGASETGASRKRQVESDD